MAYNIPFSQAIHGQQAFLAANMQNQQFFPQEDLLDMECSWQEEFIDPLLRQAQTLNFPWQQQQPLQRFVNEPERAFFTAGPLRNTARPQDFTRVSRPSDVIPSLPQAMQVRMASPSPSGISQEPLSQCSSARSPAAEVDWLNELYNQQDDFSFPNVTSHINQGRLPVPWNTSQDGDFFPRLDGNSFVNLNQVQGIPDIQEPQDMVFQGDEDYMDMEMKNEDVQIALHNCKTQGIHQHTSDRHSSDEAYIDMELKNEHIAIDLYNSKAQGIQNDTSHRHSSDEGLGASIKDSNSPHSTGSEHISIASPDDADAEGELEDEFIPADDAASDTEYSPRSTRTRKRRASKGLSPPATKRSRVSKSLPKSKTKNSTTCKYCPHTSKDAAALQRHINSTHTRAFICVFGFAGCSSTFPSKNEWKRHVSSQHLNLNSWVCELGPCSKTVQQARKDGGALAKGSEFNRKDLFTQHLRRMHAPFAVKRLNTKNAAWEERIKDLQVSCLRVKRQPPTRLACPLRECDGYFEGANCWDERMEHVAKHLEKAAGALSSGVDGFEVRQEDDEYLIEWALRERILERRAGRGYALCGAWFKKTEDDDAEGEFE